jgi:hypothetical protein
VYESVVDETCNSSGGASSSYVLDSGSTFYVYYRRVWFDSFQEVFGGTITLADGSTLLVVGVGTIRFQMWDDMIRMIIDVCYVFSVGGVLYHSMSWIHVDMRYRFAVGP